MVFRAAGAVRGFLVSTRAVAAVEFALLIPMMLVLLLASIDAGRAMAIYVKVRSASYTVDAVTNQYTTIHDSDMQQILGAAAVIMSPYSTAPVSVVVSQVSVDDKGNGTVSWSDTLNGTARAVNSSVTIPPTLASSKPPNNACNSYPCYFILGEVRYTYSPMFGYFITGPITLSDSLFVTPRSAATITRSSP
jgi:Flp pilus assembly protein TadG